MPHAVKKENQMQFQYWIKRALVGAAMLAAAGTLQAQGVVKLGLVAEFSGPFAQYGQQILGGMKAYMKQNGDTVAGKKIEIVQKDTTGPAPDVVYIRKVERTGGGLYNTEFDKFPDQKDPGK